MTKFIFHSSNIIITKYLLIIAYVSKSSMPYKHKSNCYYAFFCMVLIFWFSFSSQ